MSATTAIDIVSVPGAPGASGTPAPGGAQDEQLSFWDLLDIINPLQHLPMISSVYRRITGDEIQPAMQFLGGMLYGGVFSAATAVASMIVEDVSGRDIGEHVVAMLFGDDEPPAEDGVPVMVAEIAENKSLATGEPLSLLGAETPRMLAAPRPPWIDLAIAEAEAAMPAAGRNLPVMQPASIPLAMIEALDKYETLLDSRRREENERGDERQYQGSQARWTRAEDRRADAHNRRAELHPDFKIRAHAHAQLCQVVAPRDLAQQSKMWRRLLVERRNARQSDHRQRPFVTASSDERIGIGRQHPRFLRFLAGVDLDKATQPPARLRQLRGQLGRQLWSVDRLDDIEKAHSIADLVGLQCPDQMQFQIRPCATVIRPMVLRFLHPIFTESTLTRRQRGIDSGLRLPLAHGDQRHRLGRTSHVACGRFDAVMHAGEVSGDVYAG